MMSRQEITIKEKANKNQELRNVGAPSSLFLLWKTPRVRCKRPGGAISKLFYGTPQGAFSPFFTVHASMYYCL